MSIKSVDRWKTEELFKREGNILKSLNYNSIPKFIEQFTLEIEKNISYFLVMELIEGITIEQELKSKIYNEKEVFDFVRDITSTLSYLHSFRPPIIHRDIKPSNLIRKADGSIAIIDFGGVKDAINPNIGSTVAATFGYAAPEQILGKAVIQSDFYSLGITALVLLTKKDINDLSENLDLNSEKYNFLSNKMLSFIDRLTANKVEDRFQNSKEIIDFIDTKECSKERRLSYRTRDKVFSNEFDNFLYNYDKLNNLWNSIEKNNGKLKYLWTVLSLTLTFYIIHLLGGKEPMFYIYSFIFLTSTILFSYRKKTLKAFLNKVFTDNLFNNIEIEIVYSFYQKITDKKNKLDYTNGKELSLFKEYIYSQYNMDETKLILYKNIIKKHRGDNEKILS